MRHLGTLEGTGRLSADGQDFGEVGYSLRVSEQRGIKQAAGTLTGLETLELATETHREFTLHLEGKGTVTVVVQRLAFPSGSADFVVSGPVPGF